MRDRYAAIAAGLDERQRRNWAGREAIALGWGGVAVAARATGLARATVTRGMREIQLGETIEPGRVRRPGGGRRPLEEHDVALVSDLERLVADEAAWRLRGARVDDQERPRACRCHARCRPRDPLHLGRAVPAPARLQHAVQPRAAVWRSDPDRGEQFRLVDRQVSSALARGDPAISVEVRHREPSGVPAVAGCVRARNRGLPARGTCPAQDEELRKLGDYGVFDVTCDDGWIDVPADADSSGFVVAAIGCWWEHLGRRRSPQATTLTITAHCGAERQLARLWKIQLQRLADETGLAVRWCHFPPGTSRWHHVEHSFFSFRGRQWQGESLVSRRVVVSLIGTDSLIGGRVYARLDTASYPPRFSVPNAVTALDTSDGGGLWSYECAPRAVSRRGA